MLLTHKCDARQFVGSVRCLHQIQVDACPRVFVLTVSKYSSRHVDRAETGDCLAFGRPFVCTLMPSGSAPPLPLAADVARRRESRKGARRQRSTELSLSVRRRPSADTALDAVIRFKLAGADARNTRRRGSAPMKLTRSDSFSRDSFRSDHAESEESKEEAPSTRVLQISQCREDSF